MPDIFSRQTDVFGGSFASDDATITFTGMGNDLVGTGLLVQRLGLNYQQQVSRFYELGRNAVYYVGGRTAGDGQMDRVIGPNVISAAFYTNYGDICKARDNSLVISAAANCGGTKYGSGTVSYNAKFVVITSVGFNVAAQDMVINEGVRMMFSSLTRG